MEREFQVLTDAQDEGAASNANAKLTSCASERARSSAMAMH